MKFFQVAALGTWGLLFFMTFAIALSSIGLNIYNIVIAVRGLKAYPPQEPCSGSENLHIFLIGVIAYSALALVSGCLSGLSGDSENRSSRGSSCSGIVNTFGLVWAILGTVWISNASACHASGQVIFSAAMDCLIVLWVCWGVVTCLILRLNEYEISL
ncbi:hypothetical protein BC937DRAFT_93903 [Endogone sp. FLAS-F59071]|nr:hypothetical protein BC937DRAFT_93903 [Endogone sp. FLAS-F59071]|eukprot:RUS14390.1 hypothetical protein BC937DRAFT_93903 [Endogone sp. FLAS-F59071]